MKSYNEFIKESIRDKMTSITIPEKTKQELIQKFNELEESFKPITDIPHYEDYEEYYDLIVNRLDSNKEDLYYITIKDKGYRIFSNTFSGLLSGSHTFVDSGEYNYYIYTDFKIVWCEHDRYYDDTTDMYIIDLPYFKKVIESL